MAAAARKAERDKGAAEQAPLNKDLTKSEFGQRLDELMRARGWNQSGLARQASHYLGSPMGRDSVSNYVRGKSYPNSTHLHALALALGMAPRELLPNQMHFRATQAESPMLEIKQLPSSLPGTVLLHIHQPVSLAAALAIVEILNREPQRSESG